MANQAYASIAQKCDLFTCQCHQTRGLFQRGGVEAPTFLLLPLMLKGHRINLVHADIARLGSLVLGGKGLSLVRALRDQVTLAFWRTG